MSKAIYLFLFLFLLPGVVNNRAQGQTAGLRKFTQLDGYTASNGYIVQQDERGYIWIGTDNGGMSFDGKTFRLAQDINRSTDVEILRCLPVGSGRILMMPLSENISYIDNGKLVTPLTDTALAAIKTAELKGYSDQLTGSHWLTKAGILGTMYLFRNKTIRRYQFPKDSFIITAVINNQVIGYRQIGWDYHYNHHIYDLNSGTWHFLYDGAGKKNERVQEIIIPCATTSQYITTFNPLTHLIRIFKYQPGDSILKWVRNIIPPPQKTARPPELTIDRNNCLWMRPCGDYKGFLYYGSLNAADTAQPPYHFEEPVSTNSIFIDRNNNLWLSSPNNALYFLSEKHLKNLLLTRYFPLVRSVPQAISGDGTGRLCISYANSATINIMHGNQSRSIALNRFFPDGSRQILQLDSNRFIFFNGTIALLDIRNAALSYFHPIESMLFKDVSIYDRHSLLLATTRKVIYLNLNAGARQAPQTLFERRANTVAALPNKTILIGTPDGLYIKPQLTAPAIRVNDTLLSKANITDILPLDNGGALIGTNTQGVFLMDSGATRIQLLNISAQNDAKHIRRLYRQNDSTCWLGTDAGAFAVTFNKSWLVKQLEHYTFCDGLPSGNVTDIYVCKDTAYFATTQGLGIIPLKGKAGLKMAPPAIYINSIQTRDTMFHYPSGAISLLHHRNDLLISLSAISYESLGNIHYYYQLSPIQDSWVEVTNPEIRFTSLAPGTYTFRAYATNAKGVKSKTPVTLIINIQPTFWQTIYFKAGVFLALAALLFLAMRWYILGMEKKKYETLQQKKRLAELELEAIKAQINPHFIYNCLNSIKYLNYKAEYTRTQEYLSIFARLIRMTMQYSRQTFITVAEEEEYLAHYLQLEKLRFKDQLEYRIEVEEQVLKNKMIPAMLLQPYVENALKHGIAGTQGTGEVYISFKKEQDGLVIFICDNGPGFTEIDTSGNFGLYLAGSRALAYNELFNLNIRIERYNRQDTTPGNTGAIVKVTIHTNDYASTIQSGHYRR